jgi:hypothetical protein
MGLRGPVPNHSDDLARPRERKGGEQSPVTKGMRLPATIPNPDPEWHPIALMLWDAALESGQRDFYQSTDWVMLWSLCEEISIYKEPRVNRETGEQYHKRSGQMLQTIHAALGELLVTEGARRRVRIELQEPEAPTQDAELFAIDGYKDALGVKE